MRRQAPFELYASETQPWSQVLQWSQALEGSSVQSSPFDTLHGFYTVEWVVLAGIHAEAPLTCRLVIGWSLPAVSTVVSKQGALCAGSLTKLLLRWRKLQGQVPYKLTAEAMLFVAAILRLGESAHMAHPIDADSRDRMLACLEVLCTSCALHILAL